MIKYLILSVSLCLCAIITAEPEKRLCSKAECSKKNADNCSCYCSVKCGPRQITPEDTPKYDEEDGQCFCAPRDKALYKRNSCNVKEEAKLHK